MASLPQLKQADITTKHKIFGYNRQQRNKLNITIPMMVKYLIFAYYWIEEKYSKHGDYLEIDANNRNIVRVKSNPNEY